MTCSGNGDCDTSTGICDCYEHYSGTACQIANCELLFLLFVLFLFLPFLCFVAFVFLFIVVF